ncbi:MAG: hypothetical protein ABIJ18_05815 [archaeon]
MISERDVRLYVHNNTVKFYKYLYANNKNKLDESFLRNNINDLVRYCGKNDHLNYSSEFISQMMQDYLGVFK